MSILSSRIGTLSIKPPAFSAEPIVGYFDPIEQAELLAAVRAVIAAAPLFTPRMPRTGKPFSVRMTNCGSLGWVSDPTGYRYQPLHPITGDPWPPMPNLAIRAWRELAGCPLPPEACLVNYYGPGARMGLHQDKDEADLSAPVLSLSLGDTALFRVGGQRRRDPTRSFQLKSGDAVVLGGAARLASTASTGSCPVRRTSCRKAAAST